MYTRDDLGDLRSNCCFVVRVRWRPEAVATGPLFSVAALVLEERDGILEERYVARGSGTALKN
jgi:hypothetical protein